MSSPIKKIALVMLLTTACFDEPPAVDSLTNALQSENALSMNALSMNALSMNALSMNALSMNALSMNGLTEELELAEDNELIKTAEGRHVLKYIVRCAMPANAIIVGEDDDDEVHVFPGLLGVTPGWSSKELKPGEQEALSACMLAHVNYFGVSIAISARHPDLATSQAELDRFSSFEGAFFGNLFDEVPLMYTCTGDAAPDFSVGYPNHDADAGDRLLRRCTDSEGSETACGFVNVGPCSSSCAVNPDGSATNCAAAGVTYKDAMTIWLLEHDDPASTLDDVYSTYYGP